MVQTIFVRVYMSVCYRNSLFDRISDMIRLKKVSVHNLKAVDLELEPGTFIVFTGVSGSGKSSLAFDTIYVEGQRRYIESLSHQARRFLGELPKPEAESISGIAPTIAIEQKTAGRSPRSTVGTMTGIYDYLRVLFARIGTPHCPISKEPVQAQSQEKIIAEIQNLSPGTKIIILAPFVKGKKGQFKEEFLELLSKGFLRLQIDGEFVDLSEEVTLDPNVAHDVDIVIDRLVVNPDSRSRILESVQLALEVGQGFFSVNDTVYSQFAHSATSGLSYGPLEPHDFSFNHPLGMCPTCQGIGKLAQFTMEKIIDPQKSIAEDCCSIAGHYDTVRYGNIYNNLAKIYGFDVKKSWKKLSQEAKQVFLYGTEKKWTRMRFSHPTKRTHWFEYVHWKGVIHEARERLAAAKSDAYRKKMGELMSLATCADCKGSRIKPYPAATLLGGQSIHQLTAMPLEEFLAFFHSLKLTELEHIIGDELIKELKERVQFLLGVGLSYLSLERTSPTLSGGEAQRVRLASQIGSGLVGAIYVLDEPSIGLHPIDHHKLIATLKHLRDQGNTVIVVEHDLDTILSADRIVDVGPGAGIHGGQILHLEDPASITGQYLFGKLAIHPPKKRRKAAGTLLLKNACQNNLKNLSVPIPLGVFVCITGVSGSGKSSLIEDTLLPALKTRSNDLEGLEQIDKVIHVDQSPIGRTPRSNAATYIKLFDLIRDFFTELPESKLRGFEAGHFSFNVKEGSCSYCSGLGQIKIDMDFMEDAWAECPQCKGKRFDPEILAVHYKGKSIYDVLELDVEHAIEHFDAIPAIRNKLELLRKVGLNYLSLGQPSTTLSGGEAQRIKLAKELVRPATGKTIYILDEPTTGLHFHDIKKLIEILQELVDRGNTVIVIEHSMELIKCADWVIDLGPGAGDHGGQIVGMGTPESIAKLKTATGLALKGLKREQNTPSSMKEPREILVEGACQNNLKNVSMKIPRGKITVFTGPSGSGKSSMAFETLYAEGQRRYTETLSPYARALVKQLPKPKLEKIEGLSPSIALEQKTGGLNPRSTVGTITEIYDLLRVLFAHLGIPHDPVTKKPIGIVSKKTIVETILSLPKGEKIQLLTPIVFQKKETFEGLMERLNREGYLRIRLNGQVYELDANIPYEKFKKNELYLVIDRMLVDEQAEKRIYEALSKVDETLVIARPNEDLTLHLSKEKKNSPQTFSFNHEEGMCPECQGLGETYGAHLEQNRSIQRLSIYDVIDRLMKDKGTSNTYRLLETYFNQVGENKEILLHGGPEVEVKKGFHIRWIGLHTAFANAARMGHGAIREAILPMMKASPCPECQGARLNAKARHVFLNKLSIHDVSTLSIEKARAFLQSLKCPIYLQETQAQLLKYLDFLLSIGLHYLSLSRSAPSLSGGELQRIRLAKQLGSGLTSCLYILDEPTIGLHPFNNELLNDALKRLRDLGNTLILVEHDPMTIRAADYLFDFGPKAGKEGGMITAFGTISEIEKHPHSLTGAYLSGRKKVPIPTIRRTFSSPIKIENATLHNLKNITVEIPTAAITCLTGVSGSGKSSLMSYLRRKDKNFDAILHIDQSPIGQTPRADVSTYSEVQPLIRELFASMPLALTKGLLPRHFSPNHLRGMCRTCWGLGYKTVNLQFLPSVQIECDACHGHRLNPISLEVRYRGKHFGEILQMTVEESLIFFHAIPKMVKKLEILRSVGLHYLKLGQELISLSGGEAQRLRLSRELAKRSSGKNLYLIDEPTVGLHPEDVLKLLAIFHRLADKKNTLVIIEHNVDVIVNADYIIDLGPDAGDAGGYVIAQGTPEEVALSKQSKTAKYIRKLLQSSKR
ncbi:MAG: excinuclease ABC subunit A [Chlamydiae bacterium RIFCSPHIGHO2_12_FULL_44_59]|nr:MAG: excinuclease ABC subunit A [Chlamydiae bacterium RIFCSPHIGHO2_01_FULL_44_39]OGN59263.1 MAG: excinuclease ABC subunit A [Chlamydiae bacterium RIFCSPHIGHO2_02_FULL_45_9]OGN60202.1 MAG: excinuclease ABC subunit A [Chlamydiae bacterium RIFCSPHIGHO2_12_FULL_44_59]OGN67145.1 MAG: excinuclease ABC subunit A [Chlamydiae bacterium RIFCSPLOWO2_01_FULL_44_52]OGN67735.1 MAG: excinuclease ABC subunit A [Chlamydiae bacterium RIFCSPLOWO2_02_FULL_45_22]OGN71438.1 MAG: excinuclease ABC subunit A [Chlam